ncbi:MAG: DUF4340 domain-containing protein [Clostridia bacterium]|nr:DUF4340 domain-containing protein [Clostridia bacterium]
MPLKKTIIAALTAVLILSLVMAVILLSSPDTEGTAEVTDEPSTQVLFDQNHTDHIEQISFVRKGQDEISISRTEADGWQITDRPGLPVDPDVMTYLLKYYEQILALRTITETCEDLSEYGLDAPLLTVTLTVDGVKKTYLFGNENTYYEGYYCMYQGASSVYLLDYAYVTAFDLTVDDLLLTEELPALSSITELTWTSSAGAVAQDVSALQTALATLEIERMVDWGREQYEIYGLDSAATAVLTFPDGKTLTLRLSEGETEELIYLTVDDREIIYLVTCESIQTLLDYIRIQ